MPFKKGDPRAGRPKGSTNWRRAEFIKLIHEIGRPKDLIEKLTELTQGVKCVKYSEDGETVYERPPDREAITYLLDQAYGKAKQSLEVEDKVSTLEDELGDLPE